MPSVCERCSGGRPIGRGADAFILGAACLAVACRPVAPPPPPPPPVIQWQAPTTLATATAPATRGAVVAGRIIYTGPPITPRTIVSPVSRVAVLDESVVVNADGTLCNVLVYVKSEFEGRTFATPRKPLVIDFRGTSFDPHVLAVQTHQLIQVRNCDPDVHNFHVIPAINTERNHPQPPGGAAIMFTLPIPEIGIAVKDDIDPTLSMWIHVLAHPYFNVTNTAGVYRLEDLPPGTYVIEAWHEKLGTKQQTVTVKDGEVVSVDFRY